MMEKVALFSAKQAAKKLKFLPYVLVGGAVFAFNAMPDSHPYLQIYLTLLEVKLGIVLVYFLTKKLEKPSKAKYLG